MDLCAQQSRLDSLLRLRSGLDGLDRALITQYIAQEYVTIDEDSAIFYLDILEEYITNNYNKGIDAFVLKLRALIAERNFEYEQAMEYRRHSYQLFKEVGDYSEMGWTARGMGTMFFELGNYANATEYFILSLSAFEIDENTRGIADVYNLLGAVYYVTGNSGKAIEYYYSSIALFQEIGEDFLKAKVYNNIGIILYEQKKYSEALEYYKDALSGLRMASFEEGIASTYGNMSLCFFELGQIDKALEFVHKSRTLSVKNNRILDEISSYVNLGSFYREIMQLDSASYYLHKSLRMSEENEIKPLLEEANKELSQLYEVQENFEQAYKFHVRYFEIREQIHREESKVRIEKLMVSYEQRLKQQEIDLLTSDQKTKSLINKVFGAFIFVTVVLLFIMVYGYSNNRKKNKLLEEKNNELVEYNEKLIESETALKKVIDEKNKLFTIIAHDLRNPIAAVGGFSELLFDNFEQFDARTQKDYISQIIQGSTRTYELLENLLLWARSQMDSIVVRKTVNNVRTLIEDCLGSIQSHILKKEIAVSISVECDETVFADYDMMKAILRNLITNAVKFSFPGGMVEIKCQAVEQMMNISVADHGVGIEPEIIPVLFNQKGGGSTPGTSGETGSGLGLLICKDYTERNGGSISVTSQPGKGSTFTISIPLKELSI